MENYQFDHRFADRPHGDNIYINQLYVYSARLRMIRYSDAKVEEERRRLLSEVDIFLSSLDNQSMRIVVAGGFNAGKSTFINALINRNLMPAYAIRTTGTINCLVTGEREEWVIFRRNGQKETRTYQDADHLRSQLKAIMEKESDSTDHIEIVCPGHAFLKRFTLIDTPGLDHNQQDSIISLHQIERADALIWVLHTEGLRREDHDNLQRFQSANPNSPVIIIINQVDTLEPDELESVVRTVSNKLRSQVDQIFPFSAKHAFEGQNEKDQVKIAQSYFYELREYLHTHFFSKYHELKKLHLHKCSQLLLSNLKDFELLSCNAGHISPEDINFKICDFRYFYLSEKNKNNEKNTSKFLKISVMSMLNYLYAITSIEDFLSDKDKVRLRKLTSGIEKNLSILENINIDRPFARDNHEDEDPHLNSVFLSEASLEIRHDMNILIDYHDQKLMEKRQKLAKIENDYSEFCKNFEESINIFTANARSIGYQIFSDGQKIHELLVYAFDSVLKESRIELYNFVANAVQKIQNEHEKSNIIKKLIYSKSIDFNKLLEIVIPTNLMRIYDFVFNILESQLKEAFLKTDKSIISKINEISKINDFYYSLKSLRGFSSQKFEKIQLENIPKKNFNTVKKSNVELVKEVEKTTVEIFYSGWEDKGIRYEPVMHLIKNRIESQIYTITTSFITMRHQDLSRIFESAKKIKHQKKEEEKCELEKEIKKIEYHRLTYCEQLAFLEKEVAEIKYLVLKS